MPFWLTIIIITSVYKQVQFSPNMKTYQDGSTNGETFIHEVVLNCILVAVEVGTTSI